MKRLTYLFAILLISSVVAWADETITVTAKNSDISANLDLKVVAKLFGEAKDLEEFEKMLNDPQQALVNLDLNGDGDVDYIRVIETTNGNKHLIVLQAVLAKDIYQDVASIYVEKDEANNVSVQVIGDEYIYGKNYVIEPVYIYRPVIYDWFWGPTWYCWHSPWYWGYWPGWWAPYACIGYGAYYHRCYDYHHNHYGCSFHYAKEARPTSHRMAEGVSRRDYATTHAESSFDKRNTGITNARELSSPRQSSARTSAGPAAAQRVSTTSSQTAQGASTRSSYSGPSTRSSNSATSTRSSYSTSGVSTRSSSNVSTTRSASSASSSRQASYTPSYNTNTSTRSASTYSSGNNTRNTYSSGNSSTRSSYSGSSTRSSYSGGSSFSGGGGGYSGGSSRGGGGVSTRR